MRLLDRLSAVNLFGYLRRRFRRHDDGLNESLDRRLEALGLHALQDRLDKLQTYLVRIETGQDRMSRQLDQVRTRLSSYLGLGVALTYTVDGMPVLVNANDMGCPLVLLAGGRYEEDVTQVLLSFSDPDTVFLDIGANIGFFSLQIGRRLLGKGHVYAFEPHPSLVELLEKNVLFNGLQKVVTWFPFALSDQNGTATMYYPDGHLGGGSIIQSNAAAASKNVIVREMKRLDDVFGSDFKCDLVKIDVEGHELNVLLGMRRIVENSPTIKILFEKLEPDTGANSPLERYFRELGFDLYGIELDASLSPLDRGDLGTWTGYALAARPGTIDDHKRAQFSIYPAQLFVPGAGTSTGNSKDERLIRSANRGDVLFFGPFWFLRAGIWRVRVHGAIRGSIFVRVQELNGVKVTEFELRTERLEHVFIANHDLVAFELVAYASSNSAEIILERFAIARQA